MKAVPFRSLALLACLLIAAYTIYWLASHGLNALSALFGDVSQIFVAVTAALVMAWVGWRLTMGQGNLANSGQYERIAVWAALLMSIVSAITTSSGLLRLWTANPQTGILLMVAMSLLLGLGIQLSMLIYALSIGDDVQRLTPAAVPATDEEQIEEEESQQPLRLGALLAVMALIVVGIAMMWGVTLRDIGTNVLSALWEPSASTGLPNEASPQTPRIIGGLMFFTGLLLAFGYKFLTKPTVIGGLGKNLLVYFVLLTFSSGFGYLTYFSAMQSDTVRAIDRDNIIETETGSLVSRIGEAARTDVDNALAEARSGKSFEDLSKRIDTLSVLFVRNRDKLDDQIAAFEAQRQEIIDARARAANTVSDLKARVAEATRRIASEQGALERAKAAVARQTPQLTADLAAAEKDVRDAKEGRDGTGVASCGSKCKAAQLRVRNAQTDLDNLASRVTEAQAAYDEAVGEQRRAKLELENAGSSSSTTVEDDPVPPSVINRASFTTPLSRFASDPSREGLKKISQTCVAARDMLISLEIDVSTLPNCDVSQVDRHLVTHARGVEALKQMETQCVRRDDEIAAEAEAKANPVAPNIDAIPAYLLRRIAWLDRCLTAANTGTPALEALAVEANRLESEYVSAGYDPRRVLRSLFEGDRNALFSAAMAFAVDIAILFAGFAANSQRGRELREDRLVAPDKVARSVEMALAMAAGPGTMQEAALSMCHIWEPRPYGEETSTDLTHKLFVANLTPSQLMGVRLVLDAAGPVYARYIEEGGDRFYLIHRNLVMLINKIATSPTMPADGKDQPAADPGGMTDVTPGATSRWNPQLANGPQMNTSGMLEPRKVSARRSPLAVSKLGTTGTKNSSSSNRPLTIDNGPTI